MELEKIIERISVIVTKQLDVPSPPNADIISDLGADSLDLLEISMAIESEFGVNVDTDARTVKQLAEYVASVSNGKIINQ